MKVIAIIPAAGLGTRMAAAGGASRKPSASKQFAELQGIPILIRTLGKFAENGEIDQIRIALRKSEIAPFQKRLQEETPESWGRKTVFVEGGESRQQSVSNALVEIKADENDIVLVHDAVRPFVSERMIHDVIEAARQYGAAIVGVPAVDTIKQVERTAEGALIKATIPREKVVNAQTPQGFRFGVLRKAFDEAAADGFTGTDESSLVERSGHSVAVVMGSAQNIKITTPGDLELAEFYSQRQP
jgi:2-C-methyl-D-erythritol 4-phosphate cytidylyltransferase